MGLFAQRRGQRQIVKTPTATIDDARNQIDSYQFDEAIKTLQGIIDYNKRKKLPTLQEESLMELAVKGANMLEATEKIIVIDSIVVDKNDFLSAYKFSTETGSIARFNDYFKRIDNATDSCIVYCNELKNKIVYSKRGDDGVLRLFTSYTNGSDWSKAVQIAGLDDDGDANYPFLMSDGITLYYAAKGKNSLGGYDIFVTREGNENGRFLKPENIGMPFNSSANDYMLVIDDFSQLGWFASDRYQPEGKVCIYVFVPNESRVTFDINELNKETLRQNAMLRTIRTTWNDEDELRKAKQRYSMLVNQASKKKVSKEFELVIDDLTTYYNLDNFRNDGARKLMQQLLTLKKDYKNLTADLDSERANYNKQKSDNNKRSRIMILEQQCEQLSLTIKNMEKQIRNTEISHLKH